MGNYFLKINYVRISVWFFILLVTVSVSFLFIFSSDEGHEVNPLLLNICNYISVVVVNPFVYLFSQIAFFNDWWQLTASTIIGCLFYSLLIEMLTAFYRVSKLKNKFRQIKETSQQ